MIALCVDDEKLILDTLKRSVESMDEIETSVCFTNEIKALEWAENNKFDIAFLDIQLHVMNGLQLAEKLREINKDSIIIFCTGYSEYAVDAINMDFSDGYLVKPISPAKVRERLDKLNLKGRIKTKLLNIHYDGVLSVCDSNGNYIDFKRNKAEELFYILLEKNGEVVSTQEMCEKLWDDNDKFYEQNRNYLYTLYATIRQRLESCGAEEVLVKRGKGYCVNMTLVSYTKK